MNTTPETEPSQPEIDHNEKPKAILLFGHAANWQAEGYYGFGIKLDPSILYVTLAEHDLAVEFVIPPTGRVCTDLSLSYEFDAECDPHKRPISELRLAELCLTADLQALGEVGAVVLLGLKHASDYPEVSLDPEVEIVGVQLADGEFHVFKPSAELPTGRG